MVVVDAKLRHVQTILGSDCGYGDTNITSLHSAEYSGRVSAVCAHSTPLVCGVALQVLGRYNCATVLCVLGQCLSSAADMV